MALSNIFREPRRELTESAVGAVILGALLYIDWCFACWFQSHTMPNDKGFRALGMFLGLLLFAVGLLLLVFTHFIGEEICDSLAQRGLELRPKRRY